MKAELAERSLLILEVLMKEEIGTRADRLKLPCNEVFDRRAGFQRKVELELLALTM